MRGEVPLPRTDNERVRLLEMLSDVFEPVERDTAQVPSHEVDELLLLSSWFRRNPAELDNTRSAVRSQPV